MSASSPTAYVPSSPSSSSSTNEDAGNAVASPAPAAASRSDDAPVGGGSSGTSSGTPRSDTSPRKYLDINLLVDESGVGDAFNKAKQATVGAVLKSKDAMLKVDMKEVLEVAKDSAKVAAVAVANDLTSGEEQLTNEVANHYLDKLKYGLAGSNGTILSNFFRYQMNHHEILSGCFADKRNPYNRISRSFIIWNTLSFQFFLSCMFSRAEIDSFIVSCLIALIMAPYTTFIIALGGCEYFRRKNTCVKWSRRLGLTALAILSVFAFFFLTAGIFYTIQYKVNIGRLFRSFFVSILLNSLMPFYLGIFNWILPSWEGVLCLPQVRINCCGYNKLTPRWYPMLGNCLIKTILNTIFLAESTYEEDQKAFQEKYPNRIAIDVFSASEETSNPLGTAESGENKDELSIAEEGGVPTTTSSSSTIRSSTSSSAKNASNEASPSDA